MPVPRPLALAGALVLVLLSATPSQADATASQATWHATQADVPTARAAGRDGQGVVVAVLDSWVDRAHPDFEGRVLAGADCVGGTCRPGPAASDECDHGTHVAGTVASSSYGVAPGATVLPVRVLAYDPSSGDCVGRPDDVTAGLRFAVQSGAQVINLSLGPDVPGLSASSSIPAAVRAAAAAGLVVVFSAGNASLPVADSYGGDALIVAATGPDGTLAGYSQRGTGVDLAAPGGDPRTPDLCTKQDCVTSLFPGGRYAVAAGTSMAAPHVSGIAALLLAQDPARTRSQVIDRLLSTARPLAQAGRGLVDAAAALQVAAAPTRAQASAAPAPVNAPRRSLSPTPVPTRAPRATSPVPVLSTAAPVPTPTRRAAAPAVPATVPPSPGPSLQSLPAPLPLPAEAVPTPLVLLAGSLSIAVGAGALAARRRT